MMNMRSGKFNMTKRKIIKIEHYRFYKASGDTIILHLECGHEEHRKASQGVPKSGYTICHQCDMGLKP